MIGVIFSCDYYLQIFLIYAKARKAFRSFVREIKKEMPHSKNAATPISKGEMKLKKYYVSAFTDSYIMPLFCDNLMIHM